MIYPKNSHLHKKKTMSTSLNLDQNNITGDWQRWYLILKSLLIPFYPHVYPHFQMWINIVILREASNWANRAVLSGKRNTDMMNLSQKSSFVKYTCSLWSRRPPPLPARKATSCRSGTPRRTCVSHIRGRGRSSPCSPRPGSRTGPCCWRAACLCCRTPGSVCGRRFETKD